MIYLAEALQMELEEPWYLMELDDFLSMSFVAYGVTNLEESGEQRKLIVKEAFDNYIATIKTFLEMERNIILVIVAENDELQLLQKLIEKLEGTETLFIEVKCPMSIVFKREATRGNRVIGLAGKQFLTRYKNLFYDISVNTGKMSKEENIAAIQASLHLISTESAFFKNTNIDISLRNRI